MWGILSRFFEALFPRRRKEWFQNVNLPGGEKERYQNVNLPGGEKSGSKM